MMMVGTILGPGTIFLMLVGAINSAFGFSMNDAFMYNLIPILGFMIICYTLNDKIQLFVAQILASAYALLMMAVVVGLAKQVTISSFLDLVQYVPQWALPPRKF